MTKKPKLPKPVMAWVLVFGSKDGMFQNNNSNIVYRVRFPLAEGWRWVRVRIVPVAAKKRKRVRK